MIRVFLSFLLSVIWQILSVATIVFLVVFFTAANPNNIKGWLVKSGVYGRVVDVGVANVLYKVKIISESSGTNSGIGTDKQESTQERVVEKLKLVFPDTWIAMEMERNIDNVFDYLNGKNDKLIVGLNLMSRENEAKEAIADIFKTMVSSLPKCAEGVVGEYEDFDLFSAECLPRNMNIGEMYGIIDNGVAKIIPESNNFMNLVEIDAGDNFESTKKIFQMFGYFQVFLSSVLLLIILSVWWLVPGFVNKIKIVGINLSILGVVLFLIGFWSKFWYKEPLKNLVFTRVSPADMEIIELGFGVVVLGVEELVFQLMLSGLFIFILGVFTYGVSKYKKIIQHQRLLKKLSYILAGTVAIIAVWSIMNLVDM